MYCDNEDDIKYEGLGEMRTLSEPDKDYYR